MTLITDGRVKWHECVIDLLGRSDAIADRDEDGRAVYYLFGWSGQAQYIDGKGHLTQAEVSLGSVRMDGFALFTKADMESGRIVVAEVQTPRDGKEVVYAKITGSERAARQGRSFDCLIIDRPETLDDQTIRVTISQTSD
jgi:hypothetical protein